MNVKYTGQLLCVLMTVFLQSVSVRGSRCTEVLSRNEIREVTKQNPCIEKYTSRCGWLSLNYCTFYQQTLCNKKVNETIKTYFIKTDCCVGYFQAKNNSCIKKVPGVNYDKMLPSTTTEDPDYVPKPKENKQRVDPVKPKITGGVYAGIICGMVLLMSVIGFIVVAIRKKKRKKNSLPDPVQQVLYVPPPNTPIVKTIFSRSQSASFQKEITPSTSHRVTPNGSPTKIAIEDTSHESRSLSIISQTTPLNSEDPPPAPPEVSADTPLFFNMENLDDENVPESNI